MNKEAILKRAEQFVNKALYGEGTGHDWWHIVRVRNNACHINRTEKADAFVVDLAVLLHDVGDRKVIKLPEDDYSIAENFLREQKVSPKVIDHVMCIIKNMSFSKTLVSKQEGVSKEFYVVQDADRLDAIGAIGIARAFTYGGSKGALLYDPDTQPTKTKSVQQCKAGTSSTLHHFEEKLFRLVELMNTKTALRIAKKRHRYMRAYHAQFLAEWNGER